MHPLNNCPSITITRAIYYILYPLHTVKYCYTARSAIFINLWNYLGIEKDERKKIASSVSLSDKSFRKTDRVMTTIIVTIALIKLVRIYEFYGAQRTRRIENTTIYYHYYSRDGACHFNNNDIFSKIPGRCTEGDISKITGQIY